MKNSYHGNVWLVIMLHDESMLWKARHKRQSWKRSIPSQKWKSSLLFKDLVHDIHWGVYILCLISLWGNFFNILNWVETSSWKTNKKDKRKHRCRVECSLESNIVFMCFALSGQPFGHILSRWLLQQREASEFDKRNDTWIVWRNERWCHRVGWCHGPTRLCPKFYFRRINGSCL